MASPQPNLYTWITIFGVLLGAFLWRRRWKSADSSLFGVFIGGMGGAFFGAKLIYFLAEGWLHIGQPGFWLELAYGMSIVGALLGGYAGVEIAKSLIGYRKPTGDWFALIVPLSIAFGRVGCLSHGCCLGKICSPGAWYAMEDQSGAARWPAAPVELVFNLLALSLLFQLRRFPALQGQLFHVYLVGYGLFRFFHEFARDTPRILFDQLSGYQLFSIGLIMLGAWRFRMRYRETVYS